jgi:multidrug efflux pump
VNISEPFIHRPVGTTLLTIAVALAGGLAYQFLPVSPLPQVDYPTISVSASLPGASPETMASSVATPLERQFGRIASITQMTSSSSLGSTSVIMQFDLNRNIDAAARDVQAAINAARSNLPANLPTNPTYRKVNPADAPIMILSVTSDTYSRGRMYDACDSILAQKLSQVQGVGQVFVGGSSSPAVRVELNPVAMNNMGLSLDQVRTALQNANANNAKGDVADNQRTWLLATTDQLFKASEYQTLIVSYQNGSPVRLSDIAQVTDSVADIRNAGLANGKPAVLMIIFRQPNANIIDTVDRVTGLMPQLQAEIPADMRLSVVMDRSPTIRASVRDTELTLLISVTLVVMVVFVFLRDLRTTLIPSVAVPVSLIGTFGVMYLAGYSIDNLSLMALTISTGFVVDDAIVVIENITRHLEKGVAPLPAALQGAKEIGFTVMSISISLIAVFIPILLMGGYVGRLFREFAVTLSVAIAVSMVISLTATPMMCAVLLRPKDQQRHGRFYKASERVFDWILATYEKSLRIVLLHPLVMIMLTFATIGLTVYLYWVSPRGFFPQQDTGRLTGTVVADQDTSFQAMERLLNRYVAVVAKDPDVTGDVAFSGGGRGTVNQANMFITLKPNSQRKLTADQIVARLRPKLQRIPGASLTLVPVQDVSVGGRSSAAQYQYTLQGDNLPDLIQFAPQLLDKLKGLKGLADVNSDQQSHGLETSLVIDRPTASRLGITATEIDSILGDAFGQSEVSTMYTTLNQYHVVMEAAPGFLQFPDSLKFIYVPSTSGTLVPLSSFARWGQDTTYLAVTHQGQFPAATISFNLLPGFSLGEAVTEIEAAERQIGMPPTIHPGFQGNAQIFLQSLANEPILIAAALAAVYIVLGMLYESLIHPITILSTLPSAGVGALLALLVTGTQLDLIGLIGIILLIGIVKKNAIMMIDFALDVERREGKKPADAIFQACVLRFRPITMTTMAAALGGLPLALGHGAGSELRHPLGIAIVGGLLFSQMLTLYTTPVIYLYLDRFRLWTKRIFGSPAVAPAQR